MYSLDSAGIDFNEILDTCGVEDMSTRSALILLLMKHMNQITENPAIPVLAKHHLVNMEVKNGKYILEIE